MSPFSLASLLPFALLIAAIAVLPLTAPHWWEPNRHKLLVAAVLSAPVLAIYGVYDPHALLNAAHEYAAFVIVIGALYFVASGVILEGDLEATPLTNAAFLAIGAVLASIIGTTGASVLLVRPLLSTNRERRNVAHTVVFFIFIVCNVGGMLTPLGDPPLYLGYLRGVPFTWTLGLWREWLFASTALVMLYIAIDWRLHATEPPERLRLERTIIKPLHIGGRHNVVLLFGLVFAALVPTPWREALVIAIVAISWLTTSRHIYHANQFSLHPIGEVAALFAGIFVTMLPALDWMSAHAHRIDLSAPWHFFWVTGGLSAFLDNTPTYAIFLTVAQGRYAEGFVPGVGLDTLNRVVGVPASVLAGISLGAVMMGATTYIGNAPNMLVRAMAEQRGVRMPSFGMFIVYSAGLAVPIFAVMSWLFLR